MNGSRGQRIAVFLPSLEGGGAERMLAILANGFAKRGRKVDLVLGCAIGPYLADVVREVRLIDLRTRRVAKSVGPLVRYLRRERPAALLSALTHANVAAVAARQLSGVPLRLILSERVSLDATRHHERDVKSRILRGLMRAAYPNADAVTVVAKAMVSELEAHCGIPASKIIAIPNPVVTDDLFRLAAQSADLPPGFRSDVPLILGVGRLTAQKGFPTLIRAFELVSRVRPARLLILGEGSDRASLEALIAKLNLTDRASLPGFAPNPFPFMKTASVFALSSRYEGLPGALIQAMALGTPVVSTDCPTGPGEILEEGRWGRLVGIGDPQAMAEALLATLGQTERPDVALRARAYGEENAVSAYLDLLDGRDPKSML